MFSQNFKKCYRISHILLKFWGRKKTCFLDFWNFPILIPFGVDLRVLRFWAKIGLKIWDKWTNFKNPVPILFVHENPRPTVPIYIKFQEKCSYQMVKSLLFSYTQPCVRIHRELLIVLWWSTGLYSWSVSGS